MCRALLPFYEQLFHISGGDSRVIILLGQVAHDSSKTKGDFTGVHAIEAITQLTSDSDLIREALLPAALASPYTTITDYAARNVAPHVRASHIADFRQQALGSIKAASNLDFHPIVFVLAYQGDQSILPALLELRQRVAARDYWAIDDYVYMIESQNPPSRLLEEIRSPRHDRKTWLVQRAVELGIDKLAIKAAVQEFVSHQSDPIDKAWQSTRPGLCASLLRLQIMTADEIRDIPEAKSLGIEQ